MVLPVSNEIPDEIKLKIMSKWLSRVESSKNSVEKNTDRKAIESYVWSKLSDDRAVEFLEKTKSLYPSHYPQVIEIFYHLLSKGIVKELDGYTVLMILRKLGLEIKPDIRVRFVKDGKEVDLKEYLKND